MTVKVSCLGPEGSYSELAAKKFFDGNSEILLARNFSDVVEKLVCGEADTAVIPIENSIRGGVLQNLDLLERCDVFAVEESVLPIDHRLAMKKGVSFSDIKRIYSHEQAIGQCLGFLNRCLPRAQCIFTASTAESLKKIDSESAGIVGAHVKAGGIVLSRENIADEKKNYTRFLRLVRGCEQPKAHSKMIFLCAVCEHQPGSLLHLLQIFARYGRNLTRIESRPMKGVFGEYRFFIELEGDILDAEIQEMLEAARSDCRQFRVLGAY